MKFEIELSTVAAYTNFKIGTKEKVTIYENVLRKEYITQEEFDKRFANRRNM